MAYTDSHKVAMNVGLLLLHGERDGLPGGYPLLGPTLPVWHAVWGERRPRALHLGRGRLTPRRQWLSVAAARSRRPTHQADQAQESR